jgi:hypothetical protein
LRVSRDFFHCCGGWVKTAAAGGATARKIQYPKMVKVFSLNFAKNYGKRAQNFYNFASQKSFSVHFWGSKITAGAARLAETSAKLSSDQRF